MSYDLIQTVLLAAVVFYCACEQIGAVRYRRRNLDTQDAQLDALIAAWARFAGKVRLESAGRDQAHAVLAAGKRQNGERDEADFREAIEEFAHPAILNSRQDSA